MLLFRDIISGDEMFSDAFPYKEIEDFGIIEVECKMVQIRDGIDVNIGANASAENPDESEPLEDGVQTVNNIIHSFRLQATGFDKKSYLTFIKGYMKAVKAKLQEKNPDAVAGFEKKATLAVKKILEKFDDYQFYVGESMNPEAMVALLNYREDGITPYMTFFKDGLVQVKL